MDNSLLAEEIRELKKRQNAIILAHNYQIPEVQDIADYVADSLGLARHGKSSEAEVIVLCGVHFMAETAKILSPEKTVLLPDAGAGCPMADMVEVEFLDEVKAKHPKAKVVTYVNSSAAVKAISDIACTSSNAVKVVETMLDEEIIFVPDRNLGEYVSEKTGKEMVLWQGFCPTHQRLNIKSIKELKEKNPDAMIVAHPECVKELRDMADMVCSTSGMFDYARNSGKDKFIIATESGIVHGLKKNNPGKTFLVPLPEAVCPNMKKIDLVKVRDSLRDMKYEITLDEELRLAALASVEKMVSIG